LSPDAFDPFVIHKPAGCPQHLGDFSIAKTAMPTGKLNNIGPQQLFICSPLGDAPLRRSMLAQHTANLALGYAQQSANMVNAGATARGA
jgi:hypothetical protein